MNTNTCLRYIALCVLSLSFVSTSVASPGNSAHDGHENHREHEEHGEHEEHEEHEAHPHNDHVDHEGEDELGHGHEDDGRARITPEMAKQVGLTTSEAGPGTLRRTVTTYGKLVIPPGQAGHARARFPGVVARVYAQIGDTVAAGDVLAEIESNESLNIYDVRAPISGVISERHAVAGEVSQDQPLYTVADFDPLWVELKIFPSQRAEVAAGQEVLLTSAGLSQQGALQHLMPGSDGQPYLIARVEVDNRDGKWAPGLLAEGDVTVETANAAVTVENRALQQHDGNSVVFVQENDHYQPRPVRIGRSDGEYTEILSGLRPGERYVVDNSYLVKADIEKAGAEHNH